MKFWRRASNWVKVKDTVQGVAAVLQVVLVANESAHIWNYITGAVQLVTLFVTIWGADQNRNDIPDIYEETITVKSDSPIEITSEEKPKL